jgi:SAM-dependent methyltransferase
VTCSDYAPGAVRLAKDNFAALNAEGTFLQDDLLNSKITPESFDCVMSFGLLEHFEDLDAILGAITRLVKPGGIQIHCIIPKKFSTDTIMNALMFPPRLAMNALKGRWAGIVTRSFRDFPHYENSFTAVEYCKAFERSGSEVLRCEAGGILYPLLNIPLGVGDAIARTAPRALSRVIRTLDRQDNRFLHFIAPTFYIVARKNG